nr:MAG TPA: hypothetical protein [Caudoviricetes sp.]
MAHSGTCRTVTGQNPPARRKERHKKLSIRKRMSFHLNHKPALRAFFIVD